jgi:hypothetical protein
MDSPHLVVDSSGYVGIGTISPSTKLEVVGGTSTFSYDDITPAGTASSVYRDAVFGSTDTANTGISIFGSGQTGISFGDAASNIQGQVRYQHSTNTLELGTSGFLNMFIDSAGKVGIGKPVPVYQLDVLGSGGNGGIIHVKNTDAVQYPRLAIQSDVKGYHIGVGGSGAGAGYANNLYFYDNNVAAIRMVIDTSGNVGIGTVSPMTKLHIQSGNGSYPDDANNHLVVESSSHSYIGLGGGTSSDVGIHFGDSGGIAQGRIAYKNSDNSMRFMANSSERLTILASGSVGIGSTDPYSRLDVNGVITNRTASQDPNFTVAVVGGVSTLDGGSLQFTQGFGGTSAAGDTVVFRYNAASWKSWSLDYTFAFYNGLIKGTIGGYSNNSMDSTNAFLSNTANATVVATNSGQNVIVTFTGNFGIHMMCDMRYSQGGGDGSPRADRASLTFNS